MILSYQVCMAGPYHIENGLPCQDAYAVREGADGMAIAGCADGLGSELYSDAGSEIAVKNAVEYCAERVRPSMEFAQVKAIMNNAFVHAYKAVLNEAAEAGNSEDEYDTTLCLAIYDGRHLYFGQSGDSGIVALLENGTYVKVTEQQRDQDGCVYPLCWGPEKWVFGELDEPVSSVMLMSDGVFEQICPPALKRRQVNINVALAQKFLDQNQCGAENLEALEKGIYGFLEHYPRRLLDDDKTVVVLLNTERPAARRDEDYYKAPDWEAIRAETRKRLYPDEEVTAAGGEPAPEAALEEAEQKKTPPWPPGRLSWKTRIPLCALMVLILMAVSIFSWAARDVVSAHVPESCLGVLTACFLANASLFFPAPSILLVIQYAMLIDPAPVVLCGALGASLGEMVGFLLGKYGGGMLPPKAAKRLRSIFPRYRYLCIFVFAALPLPLFDVVGILAGAARMKTGRFFAVCFAGKLVKMAGLTWPAVAVLKILT